MLLTQKPPHESSKIFKKRFMVFQGTSVFIKMGLQNCLKFLSLWWVSRYQNKVRPWRLYQKLKVLFPLWISRLPLCSLLKRTALVFLVLLIFYCGHQHTHLNQLNSINTSLRNFIDKQQDTLRKQDHEILAQMNKSQAQEDALIQEILALEEMTLKFQSMAEELRQLHRQTIQLASLGEEVKKLAHIKGDVPSTVNTGMGGNSQNFPPILSLSLDLPGDSDSDINVIQQHMVRTQNLLNQQLLKFKTLKKQLEIKNKILACTPSVKPASGIVTSKFGPRLSPFSGKQEFHTGIDIANKAGTNVYATARGKVIFARKKWLIGNMVIIDHGNNIITKYGHLKKFLVKKGDVVNRGDIIGLMGNTGNSTGPHVHYEVVVNGKPENPANYFSTTLSSLNTSVKK